MRSSVDSVCGKKQSDEGAGPAGAGRGWPMQLGMIGLGRMGWFLAARLDGRRTGGEPGLSNFIDAVQGSGEGRWTVMAAVEEGVPAEVLSASLYTRFRPR